eukprot:Gb_37782 [translate_table: standard]
MVIQSVAPSIACPSKEPKQPSIFVEFVTAVDEEIVINSSNAMFEEGIDLTHASTTDVEAADKAKEIEHLQPKMAETTFEYQSQIRCLKTQCGLSGWIGRIWSGPTVVLVVLGGSE